LFVSATNNTYLDMYMYYNYSRLLFGISITQFNTFHWKTISKNFK